MNFFKKDFMIVLLYVWYIYYMYDIYNIIILFIIYIIIYIANIFLVLRNYNNITFIEIKILYKYQKKDFI